MQSMHGRFGVADEYPRCISNALALNNQIEDLTVTRNYKIDET